MASRNMAKYLKKVVEPPSALARPRPIFKKPRLAGAKPSAEAKWQRVKVGLLVRFDAKPGKENELAGYLRAGLTRGYKIRAPRPGSRSASGQPNLQFSMSL